MKIKVQLLIMLLCMLAFDLSAHDFEVGGIYYEYNNGSDGGPYLLLTKGLNTILSIMSIMVMLSSLHQ